MLQVRSFITDGEFLLLCAGHMVESILGFGGLREITCIGMCLCRMGVRKSIFGVPRQLDKSGSHRQADTSKYLRTAMRLHADHFADVTRVHMRQATSIRSCTCANNN